MFLSSQRFFPAGRRAAAAPYDEMNYLSPVRRIQRLATKERICAMTFANGPCRLPTQPDIFRGKSLTLVLAEILERFNAKGTFLIIGDTSGNYPDHAGRAGTPRWNGVAYDHYPAFERDGQGGLMNCIDLADRLLAGGHELAGHSYAHLPYGATRNGKRKRLIDFEQVLRDLERLQRAVKEECGYSLRLARPPHFSGNIRGGFNSYDAFALMGYQYLGGSYEGAGVQALKGYNAEVEAAWKPMERLLLDNPDSFRGQIISQQDGFNMAGRSPVAESLEKQLRLLTDLGYKIVTVSELMVRAPFLDVGIESKAARAARRLLNLGWCPAYRDNSLRENAPLYRGELAMMAFGWETARRRIALIRAGKAPFRDMDPRHPYAAAAERAVETGAMTAENGAFRPEHMVSAAELQRFCDVRLGRSPTFDRMRMTHGETVQTLDALLER